MCKSWEYAATNLATQRLNALACGAFYARALLPLRQVATPVNVLGGVFLPNSWHNLYKHLDYAAGFDVGDFEHPLSS